LLAIDQMKAAFVVGNSGGSLIVSV